MSTHRNLSTLVRLTLHSPVRAPAIPEESAKPPSLRDNLFVEELVELERFRLAESRLLAGEVERRGVGEMERRGAAEVEGHYPVFSSTLSPLHRTRLTLLSLNLSWHSSPPPSDTLSEYIHTLTQSRKAWRSNIIPTEVDYSNTFEQYQTLI